MQIDQDELNKINDLIKNSNRFLIIPHKNPDGDTIGSALSLYMALFNIGKGVDIICQDDVPEDFYFLPEISKIKKGKPVLDYDAYFILDAGAPHMTGFHETCPELFMKGLEVVNIDHHKSNESFGKYNIVIDDSASATMIMFELFRSLDYKITRDMATCLLTGIYTDTGSMMHSNTSPEVLRAASRLLGKGADLRSMSKIIFNTTKISTMKLWGRVLKSISRNEEGITMSVVTKKDFDDTGADYSEISGVVDYINSVPDSKYSVILTERDGKVKGSLRTLDDTIDVAEIASAFGGGGHTKAAGFTMPGKLEKEVRWKVVN